MNIVVTDLGWVDLYSGCSIVCQILLEQMGIWQNWLDKMVEHSNQIQHNRGSRPPGSPCRSHNVRRSEVKFSQDLQVVESPEVPRVDLGDVVVPQEDVLQLPQSGQRG